MKFLIKTTAIAFSLALSGSVMATGLATCDTEEGVDWGEPEDLQQKLEQEGWVVRRIKEDGGCYEVYALDADGERVEAYFHPITFESIPIEED